MVKTNGLYQSNVKEEKEPQSRLSPTSPSVKWDDSEFENPKPKREKKCKPQPISITEKEQFIAWLRSCQSQNPQLKRIRLKDGGFRDCVPRGLIDLFNEFRESQ